VSNRARTSARRKPVAAPSPPSEPAQTYDFAVSIGQVARRIREELGLTLANVAQEARISPGMLSRLETGQVSPSLETIVALSRALGVRPALLLQEVGESGDGAQHVPHGHGLEVVRRGTKIIGSFRERFSAIATRVESIGEDDQSGWRSAFPAIRHAV